MTIKGYRELSQEEIDFINENKILEERVLRHWEKIKKDFERRNSCVYMGSKEEDHINMAFMLINRFITQPQRISLAEDES